MESALLMLMTKVCNHVKQGTQSKCGDAIKRLSAYFYSEINQLNN